MCRCRLPGYETALEGMHGEACTPQCSTGVHDSRSLLMHHSMMHVYSCDIGLDTSSFVGVEYLSRYLPLYYLTAPHDL
jgi:hypothetical protein